MLNMILIFKADGDSIDKALTNIRENYPEFIMSNKIVTDIDSEYDVSFAVYGQIEDDENTIHEMARLTHHAEGIYEDTEFEYVHVEVCIDGEWYGRNE